MIIIIAIHRTIKTAMKRILITGCNRGIGLELVKQLISHKTPPSHLIATCRSIEKAKELHEISQKNKNVHILEFDVTNFKALDHMTKTVGSILGDEGLNVLVNNAGVSTKFTRLNMVKVEQMMDNFTVNTLAPLMLTKASVMAISLHPGWVQTDMGGKQAPLRVEQSVSGILATLASLGEQHNGTFLQYDGKPLPCLHPGWVQTDMGGKQAPLRVEQSVSGILATLATLGEQHNGTFLQYDGKPLPW
ncbi:hypothetical protein B566_EDAN013167 [Ephemera danica]|nr:hypothetical protein B566_EDAN013167 [Ephemera danica]